MTARPGSTLCRAPPARAQRTEVLRSLGHLIGVQLHHDLASQGTADGHVEEDAGVRHRDPKLGFGEGSVAPIVRLLFVGTIAHDRPTWKHVVQAPPARA
jgi:hypothetical protein